MRNHRLAIALAVTLGACGGASGTPPPANTTPTSPSAAAPARAGSSGVGALDWNVDAATIRAQYPDATPSEEGLAVHAEHEGRAATLRFVVEDDQLHRIDVGFDGTFPSMEACASTFAEVRAAVDGRLGPSAVENLAAYWTTDTSEVTLWCNPDDNGIASLGASYGRRETP